MRLFLFVLTLTLSLIAFAKAEVIAKSIVEKEIEVTAPDGKKIKQRVAVKGAAPGEEVIYTTTVTNSGDKPAASVVVTNPVPEHTAYIGGSAQGANTEIAFSIDGGKVFAASDKLIVKKDGVQRLALPSEYTHIRWTYRAELSAGQNSDVGFKARVK
ncbi:MAG: hypothetical protein ACREV2_14040 [Burkholderiales bacterium]